MCLPCVQSHTGTGSTLQYGQCLYATPWHRRCPCVSFVTVEICFLLINYFSNYICLYELSNQFYQGLQFRILVLYWYYWYTLSFGKILKKQKKKNCSIQGMYHPVRGGTCSVLYISVVQALYQVDLLWFTCRYVVRINSAYTILYWGCIANLEFYELW